MPGRDVDGATRRWRPRGDGELVRAGGMTADFEDGGQGARDQVSDGGVGGEKCGDREGGKGCGEVGDGVAVIEEDWDCAQTGNGEEDWKGGEVG